MNLFLNYEPFRQSPVIGGGSVPDGVTITENRRLQSLLVPITNNRRSAPVSGDLRISPPKIQLSLSLDKRCKTRLLITKAAEDWGLPILNWGYIAGCGVVLARNSVIN